MDERFDEPGGGFVCLDLYARALALPGAEPMMLLGEGTFHQPHGGVSTDAPPGALPGRVHAWHDRYRALRGHDLPLRTPDLVYVGSMPEPWRRQLAAWALRAAMEDLPDLADAVRRLDAALAARPPADRSVWTELHAVRDLLLDARREVAAARGEAAAARAELARLRGTRSWRLTTVARWAAGLWRPGGR
jgi:hypothetical protein